MKKIFKNWNWFEIIFLVVSLLTITTCFIFAKDKNILSFIASMLGIVSVIMVAKGLVVAPFFCIVSNILYAVLSLTQRFYGESIIYFCLMIPINIGTIITWLKHKNSKNSDVVQVNKLKKVEYLAVLGVALVSTVAFYFLLKAINTNELIVSTLSLIFSLVAAYLSFRRCKFYALAFLIDDVIQIVMWGLAINASGIAFLPTLICFALYLINDIYALFHWIREEKNQSRQLQNEDAASGDFASANTASKNDPNDNATGNNVTSKTTANESGTKSN